MAILEELPGVKVTVRIAGKDCVEYEDPDAADIQASCPTSSKYIESVDDAEFCIHFHMDSEYNWDYKEHSLCVDVCVDGQMLTRKALKRRDLINQQFDGDIVGRPVLSTETGEWFLPIPKFSAVNKVDDTTKDRIEKDREVAKNLGIITVKLHRMIVHDDYYVPVSTPVKSCSLELTEKSLKGKEISHGTTFAAARISRPPLYTHCQGIPGEAGPTAEFHFKYRSKEALKREMIIPRTPAPSPTIQDDLDGFSDAKKAGLGRGKFQALQSIKEIKKEQPVAKRGFSEVFDLTNDDLPSRPIKRTAEVIDLTDD